MEGVAPGPSALKSDDPFDALAGWPALTSFVDEIGGLDAEQSAQGDPLQQLGNDHALHRSLSLPAYLNQATGPLGGVGPLSQGLRAGSFGGPMFGGGNMSQGLDQNAEISARLVSMLSKVCGSSLRRAWRTRGLRAGCGPAGRTRPPRPCRRDPVAARPRAPPP